MNQLFISIFGFLIAIGLLVTVHEFGHFSVARFFGIRVLRFSIGFGKPLLNWFDKSGTEYVIAAIPLGGYVSLLGEKGQEVSGSDQYQAYSYKPVWVRMAVLLAGPVFNFLLAFVAFWLMFLIGISSMAPILGNLPKGSVAELAGLHQGQEIVSIENKPTPSWEKVSVALMEAIGDTNTVDIEVRERKVGDNDKNNANDKKNEKEKIKDVSSNRSNMEADKKIENDKNKNKGKGEDKDIALQKYSLEISNLEKQEHSGDVLKDLGFVPMDPFPAVVGRILPETPAEKAGLMPGDRILGIAGHTIHSRADLNEYVQNRAGENISLEIARGDRNLNLTIQPMSKVTESGKTIGFMGIEYQRGQPIPAEFIRLEKYDFMEAAVQSIKRTGQYIVMTFLVLKKMLLGSLSIKQISGPIAIAQYAGYTVAIGLEYFLSFLAVISIGLGVINLLPIPLLDGGQLMYCVWEVITGRRVSDQIQKVGVMIGGGILLALTFVAFYNDILRLIVK